VEYRRLGRSDITVSTVCLGCWPFAGDPTWGPQEEAQSVATVHAALDAGINFFDTAENYGKGLSEETLGRALGRRRKEAVIATKVGRRQPVEIRSACENSLRRLRTDYIDLYQIHWPSRSVPVADQFEALERLREEGKVLAVGVCNFGVSDLSELLAAGRCEANQLPYSLLWRAIEFEIQRRCVENDIGILTYSSLAQGLLTGKFRSAEEVPEGRARTRLFSSSRPLARHREPGCEAEVFAALERVRATCDRLGEPMAAVALAWLLHQRGVTSVIAGARRPEQVAENARAAELKLDPDVVRELSQATEEVKQKIGSNADMWQTDSRIR